MIKEYKYIDISKQNINLHGKPVIIWGDQFQDYTYI